MITRDNDRVTSGALAHSYTVTTRSAALVGVAVTFDTAPTTSENLTVTVNSDKGADYDVVALTRNPSVASDTDILFLPEGAVGLPVFKNDSIDVAFPNTDNRTVTSEIKLNLEPSV